MDFQKCQERVPAKILRKFQQVHGPGHSLETDKGMNGHSQEACIPPASSIDGSPLDNFSKAETFAKSFALPPAMRACSQILYDQASSSS